MKKMCFTLLLLGCAMLTWPQSVQADPGAKWRQLLQTAPDAQLLSAASAKPRGVRLTIYSFFSVTNTEDGFRDNNVEMYGLVVFNGQRVWSVAKQNAISSANRRNINTAERTFDVIFNDPRTWTLRVSGYLNDYDKGSSDDAMWNPRRKTLPINIKQMYEKSQAKRDARFYSNGDNDSESADLVVLIRRSEDIF